MRCPVCFTENDDSVNFCEGCGTPIPHCPGCGKVLTSRDPFCDNCGTRVPQELLIQVTEAPAIMEEVSGWTDFAPQETQPSAFCENCGKPCRAGSRYCGSCEEILFQQEYTDEEEEEEEERPRRRVGLVILLVILLLLVGLFIGGFAAVKSGLFEIPSLDEIFTSNDKDADKDDKDDRDDEDVTDEDEDGDEDGSSDPAVDENADDDSEDATYPQTEETATMPQPEETTEETVEETTEETTEPTEETTEATTGSTVDESDPLIYFIQHCDEMYFTTEDLAGFTADDCRYARNACYAKSGRMFNDSALQAYYEQFDWYNPTISPNNFTSNMMNAYQVANLNLVLAYESSRGY